MIDEQNLNSLLDRRRFNQFGKGRDSFEMTDGHIIE